MTKNSALTFEDVRTENQKKLKKINKVERPASNMSEHTSDQGAAPI